MGQKKNPNNYLLVCLFVFFQGKLGNSGVNGEAGDQVNIQSTTYPKISFPNLTIFVETC